MLLASIFDKNYFPKIYQQLIRCWQEKSYNLILKTSIFSQLSDIHYIKHFYCVTAIKYVFPAVM
jgi:hypothetical protein